jgi:large subunit ribosomal protein L6
VSRIGKKPIEIPNGVSITLANGQINVKGPKGSLSRPIPPMVEILVEGNHVVINRKAENRSARAMHGLARTVINNMVIGVNTGFTRMLEINGVGYRAEAKKGRLSLALGYSHPIDMLLPEGIAVKVDKNRIELTGIDKEVLGQLCAVIRAQRPPEPYKGKGIKYVEEQIRHKVGKAGVG